MPAALTLAFPFLFAALMLIVSTAASVLTEKLLGQELDRAHLKLRFAQYAEAISVLVSIPALAWGLAQLLPLDTTGVLLLTAAAFVVAFGSFVGLMMMGTQTVRNLRKGLGDSGPSWVALALIAGNSIVALLICTGVIAPSAT